MKIKALQEVVLLPAAAGLLSGAVGATDPCLNWKSLMAVKIATPAKTKVAIKIITVATLPFKKFFI